MTDQAPNDRSKQKEAKPVRGCLFTCRGRIDWIEGVKVLATVFRNDGCDDPRGVELRLDDITGEGVPEVGRWISYGQYRRTTEGVESYEQDIQLLPDDCYTPEEAQVELERLMATLPDDF